MSARRLLTSPNPDIATSPHLRFISQAHGIPVRDRDAVITHKVDYDTWRGDWNDVYDLVKEILEAKVL